MFWGEETEPTNSVDLWAIGIFIYELTQGEAPFKDPKETVKVHSNLVQKVWTDSYF